MPDVVALFTGFGWGIGCVEINLLQNVGKFNTQFVFRLFMCIFELRADWIEKKVNFCH